MGESEEFVQRGLWGRSGFCLLEMRRGVSQTSKWLCSSSLSGQERKGGKVPLTSFLQPSASAHPWEAGRGLGDCCAQPVGMAAPTPTRGRVPARDAGHGKPLPCTLRPPMVPGKARTAAPGCSEIPRPNRVAARARIPVAELAPAAAPASPPQRRRPSPPAPQSPNPERSGPPCGAAAAKRGAEPRDSPARWIPGRLGGARGAGEQGPQTQTLLSLSGRRSRHSSRSGWRGPGGDPAARAVARRALQPPAPPALRALGRGGKRAAVRLRPSGEARSSLVVSALKMCWMREDGVGFKGPELEFQGDKDGKGGRESFSVWC